jgi:hypothetical protein
MTDVINFPAKARKRPVKKAMHPQDDVGIMLALAQVLEPYTAEQFMLAQVRTMKGETITALEALRRATLSLLTIIHRLETARER